METYQTLINSMMKYIINRRCENKFDVENHQFLALFWMHSLDLSHSDYIKQNIE